MKYDVNKAFGKRLTDIRQNMGLSQEEFAEQCGIHRTYLGNLERGEKSPTLNTIAKIAENLNMKIKDFFKEDDEWN